MPLPDKQDLASYGGVVKNFSDVIDPTTDEDAKFRNFYVNDVTRMGRTACRAIVAFIGVNNADPTAPLIGFSFDTLWGNSDPAYTPTFHRASEGIVEITFPQQVVQQPLFDELPRDGGGITHNINIGSAEAQVACSDGTLRHARCEIVNAYTIRVRLWLGTALDDCPGQRVTVWAF